MARMRSRAMSAQRQLSGQKRTRYAQHEFFAFCPLIGHRSVSLFAFRILGHRLGFAHYSGLILAARITFAHLAVSDLMRPANSSGELRDVSRPSCAILSRTS